MTLGVFFFAANLLNANEDIKYHVHKWWFFSKNIPNAFLFSVDSNAFNGFPMGTLS
jgi:hypothetical protein